MQKFQPEKKETSRNESKKERKERREKGGWVYLSNLSWNHSTVIEMPMISAARTKSIKGSDLNNI